MLDPYSRDQLVAHVAEEVRLLDPRVELARLEPQVARRDRLLVLGRRDVRRTSRIARKHLVAARDRARGPVQRVVARRRLRQAGQQRRLPEPELARVLREVGLRRGLDPVGVVAVVDLVHVLVEDPVLRPAAAQLDREARLLDLALERPLLRDVEVAHELLRDRRAALDDLRRRGGRSTAARAIPS